MQQHLPLNNSICKPKVLSNWFLWWNVEIKKNIEHNRISPKAEPRETLRFEWNKINCFLRDQPLSDLLHSWKFWSWRNSLNLTVMAVIGQHSWVTVHCYHLNFATCSAQRFWKERVLFLDVMWPRSNQWEHALFGKTFQLYNNKLYFTL